MMKIQYDDFLEKEKSLFWGEKVPPKLTAAVRSIRLYAREPIPRGTTQNIF